MDPVLHRISIQPLSRPLPSWNSPTEREFILGFQEALKAYKALVTEGFLDFDINAGNIYFQSTRGTIDDGKDRNIFVADCLAFDEPLVETFFADFDLCPEFDGPPMLDVAPSATGTACGTTPAEFPETSNPTPFPVSYSMNSGQCARNIARYKSITPVSADGTVIFMATEILQAISEGKLPVPRNKYHGLESLIWVFFHNICMRYRYRTTLRARFDSCFMGDTLPDILSARAETQRNPKPLIYRVSLALHFLLDQCFRFIKIQNPPLRDEEPETFQPSPLPKEYGQLECYDRFFGIWDVIFHLGLSLADCKC